MQDICERESGKPLSDEARAALAIALGAPGTPPAQGPFVARDLTVLLADLRGYTFLSERYSPTVVLEVINRFLIRMSQVVAGNGGRIEKFMGDSVMAVFGLPEARGDDAQRAVTCALQMQAALDELNAEFERIDAPRLYMGIGISSGWAMTGQVGSALFSEHAVIGDDVNLAARIEAVSLRGQVLISDTTYARCRGFVVTAEPVSVYVKGKTLPVAIHEVIEVPTLGLKARRHDLRASPRVETRLPFTYYVVQDKVVASQPLEGMLMDLSYHGAALRLGREHPPHTEIKLSLAIPFVGEEAADIYARIIRTRAHEGQYLSGIEFTGISEEAAALVHRFVDYLLQSDHELKKP